MREASYTSFRLGLYKPLKQLFKADKPDAESGDLDYLRTDFDRETTKKLFIDVSCRPDSPFILKFAAGGASGGLGSVVGNPFDILKTKMMASETGLGLAETAGSIFANQGVLGFYRGIDANIARAVVNNGTKMACYDQSKGLLQEHVGLSGISLQAAASFVAGFFMTCTVAPFDICRTRLMNQRRHRVARWGGVSRQKSIGVLFPGYCSESSRADCCERLSRRAPRETMVFVEISRITDWGPLRAPPGSRPPWGGDIAAKQFGGCYLDGLQQIIGLGPGPTTIPRKIVNFVENCRCDARFALPTHGLLDIAAPRRPADGAKVYNNIADTFVKIATKEGPLTLWAGFIPMWARIAPTTTFQLLFFEYFSKLAGISAT